MGKGAGDMDGILQLAGGILVGGYALYQLTKDEGRPHTERRTASKAAPVEQRKAVQVVGQQSPVHVYHARVEAAVAQADQVETTKVAEAAAHDRDETASCSATSESSEEEDTRPGWMASEPANDDAELGATKPQQAKPQQAKSAKPAPVVTSAPHAESDAEEDEYMPSWMSQHQPQTRPDEVTTPYQLKSARVTTRVLTSTNEAVSNVAFAFSDNLFLYPGASRVYFGEKAAHKATVSRNSFGHTVDVQVLETRAGAGEAALGALSNGAKATILASSSTLKEMVPAMYEMAAQRLPAVIHAAAFAVDDDLAVQQDLTDVMAVRDTGFTMLGSCNGQEAHDMAVVAHVLAHKFSMPVLHFADGTRLEQFAQLTAASDAVLENIAEKHGAASKRSSFAANAGLEAASHRDRPHGAAVVQATLKQLSACFGTEYAIFEYVGSPSAEAVIVAMGSAAAVVQQTVASSRNVGVLKIRLLKPWSAADFLDALPLSARRLCVLDQADSLPLFNEIAAAFHSESALSRPGGAPLIVAGRVQRNSAGFSPAMVHAVVNNLLCDRPQANFQVGLERAATSLQVDIGSAPSTAAAIKQLVVFGPSRARLQVEVATHLIADQLSNSAGLNTQQFAAVDAYAGDAGVVRAELRLAPEGVALPESYEIGDAQVVLIAESLLKSSGAAAVSALREGGSLVLLPTVPGADREAGDDEEEEEEDLLAGPRRVALPAEVQAALARKGAHVVSVDALGLLQRAADAAGVRDKRLLETASLWIALAGALRVLKGPAAFDSILAHIKNALRTARPFGAELGLVNAVSASLGLLGGYLAPLAPADHVASAARAPLALSIDGLSPISQRGSPVHAGASSQHRFVPRLQVQSNGASKHSASLCGPNGAQISSVGDKAALPKLFPEAYNAKEALRPSEHGVHLVRLTKNQRLTPLDYERNVFHLEFDISGTSLKYQIGDALGVFGHNDEADVDAFIAAYGLKADALVSIPSRKKMDKGLAELVSVRNLLIKHLDILGKPSKKFYCALAGHASSRYEYLKLMHTGTDDNEAFKLGVNEGVTYADLLLHYKTARPTIEQIVEMVPFIQARHYSIASSMKLNPRSVHLLVVAVDWVTPLGRTKYGQCTRYLANLDPSKGGDIWVSVDVMPSVLRLPEDPKRPIVMSGLGTGMAPFRAFVQERKYQKELGMEVGPVVLFFGSRHRHQEWLYGDEWEQYHEEGLVTHLGLAFSRDQDEKIYIQDRIEQSTELMGQLMGPQKGTFYLCGPTWPVPAVNAALCRALNPEAAKRGEVDMDIIENLKDEGRLLYEVY